MRNNARHEILIRLFMGLTGYVKEDQYIQIYLLAGEEEVEELKDLKLELTERNKEMKNKLQDLEEQKLKLESEIEDEEKEGTSQEDETKIKQPKQDVHALNKTIDDIRMMNKKTTKEIHAVKNAALRKMNRKIKKLYKLLLDTLTTAVSMVTTCDGTQGSTRKGGELVDVDETEITIVRHIMYYYASN